MQPIDAIVISTDPLVCLSCNERFRDKQRIRTHMNAVHGGYMKSSCYYCSKRYRDDAQLQRHVLSRHVPNNKPPTTKRHVSIHGPRVHYTQKRRRHRRLNEPKRRHQRLHDPKPYKKQSLERSSWPDSITSIRVLTQKATHEGGFDLYRCPYCLNPFKNEVYAQRHVYYVHGDGAQEIKT